jgi:hypothetical protein
MRCFDPQSGAKTHQTALLPNQGFVRRGMHTKAMAQTQTHTKLQ